MNRAQRRKAYFAQPAWKRMPVEARAAALVKNGITVEDLKKAQNDGYQLGKESTIGTVYAAIALQVKETLGMDQDAIVAFLRAIDDKVVNTLDSWDRIEEVYEETGISIDFHDPLERVQENACDE